MIRYFLAAVFLVSSALPAFADGLVLKFSQKTVTTLRGGMVEVPGKGQKPLSEKDGPREEKEEMTVTLYPASLSIETLKGGHIYDFAAKRMYVLDKEKKLLYVNSLYAHTLFMNAEKRNRQMMSQMMEKVFGAGGPAKAPPGTVQTPLDIDAILGAERDATTSAEVKSKEDNGKITFTAGGRVLADFTPSAAEVPAALHKSYARFIVYSMMTHPAVKKAAYGNGKVPQVFHYVVNDGGRERDVALALTGTETVAGDAVKLPQDLKETYSQDPRIDGAIRKARTEEPPALSAMDAKIQGYLDAKDLKRAVLATMEMVIIKGGDVIQSSKAGGAAFRAGAADAETKPLMMAIMKPPQTDAEYAEKTALLDGIKTATPDYAHIADIYKANHASMWIGSRRKIPAGDVTSPSVISDKLSNALAANPWLTGAYLDLAAARFQMYDMTGATALWDQAARLGPSMPALKKVAEMQAKIEQDYPEYF